jgi:hypothetical protein
LAVFLKHNKIDISLKDIRRTAFPAKLGIRTQLPTNPWTLMSTSCQLLFAAMIARNDITWDRARHTAAIAPVTAIPSTLLRARGTWIATRLGASAMFATYFTGPIAARTRSARMTWLIAGVRTGRERSSAGNVARTVIINLSAPPAWISAAVPARQEAVAWMRASDIIRAFMTLYRDIMAATGHFSHHRLFAFHAGKIPHMLAFHLLGRMSAWKHNI